MIRKTTLVGVSLAIAGAACAAIAAAVLKKPGEEDGKASKPVSYVPADPQEGTYSFVSGYKNAKTVEVKYVYDAAKFISKIIEEEFLAYTSDSHVAAIYGEDFNIQLEYADYVSGEDYQKLAEHLAEKYKGFEPVIYGDNSCCRYFDGNNLCVCFPAGEYSYLLATVIKNEGSDLDYLTMGDDARVSAILSSITVEA